MMWKYNKDIEYNLLWNKNLPEVDIKMDHNILRKIFKNYFNHISMKLSKQTYYTMVKCLLINCIWAEITIDFIQSLNYKYEKVNAMVVSICCCNINFVIWVIQASTFQISIQLTKYISTRKGLWYIKIMFFYFQQDCSENFK